MHVSLNSILDTGADLKRRYYCMGTRKEAWNYLQAVVDSARPWLGKATQALHMKYAIVDHGI